jgi:hypothetical protein
MVSDKFQPGARVCNAAGAKPNAATRSRDRRTRAGLLALPILEAIAINYDVTLASALGGGVVAMLAVAAGYGISRWQCSAQIAVSVVPAIRSDLQDWKGCNMSLVRRLGTLTTLSFAAGVMLGLGSVTYAQSGADHQLPAHRPGPQLALDRWPTVAGHRRQPTAAEINQRLAEHGTAPGAPQLHDEDHEVQQLYDEIMRQTDPALRP